jgi:AcrR family transcriptional regulator
MTQGRRERKKEATRRALSDAATRLFLARGFDKVTVAEIAEAADTAVSTLFAHFPAGKEALVLGDGEERGRSLTAAVRERGDRSVLDALRDFLATRGPFEADSETQPVVELVAGTPALRAYARRMWTDNETALAEVIAAETGREADVSLRLLARYVLEIPDLAGTAEDAPAALDIAFEHLKRGWPGL